MSEQQQQHTSNGGKSPAGTSDSDSDSIFSNKCKKSPVGTSDSDSPPVSFFRRRPREEEDEEDDSNASRQRRMKEDCNGGGCTLDLSLGSLSSSHSHLNLSNGSRDLPLSSDLPEFQSPLQQRQSLSPPAAALPLLPSPPRYPPHSHQLFISHPAAPAPARSTTKKKPPASSPLLRVGKSETITPPYEWATNRRAGVHTLDYLQSKQINAIKGDVQCRRCEAQYKMEFDLRKKFGEVARFIWENRAEMAERAPDVWKNPILPSCNYCGQENSVKPVIGSSKKAINWLFLLLGQLLGCCTLDQLRYFCKHTRNHRTGAKDRVLYLAYLNLCKQLDPTGPFDR